jgi:protease IV
VAHDLPFVDYDAPNRSVFPFLGGSVHEFARSVLGLPLDLQPTIEKLTGQKLFLDGLVSVWQVDRD